MVGHGLSVLSALPHHQLSSRRVGPGCLGCKLWLEPPNILGLQEAPRLISVRQCGIFRHVRLGPRHGGARLPSLEQGPFPMAGSRWTVPDFEAKRFSHNPNMPLERSRIYSRRRVLEPNQKSLERVASAAFREVAPEIRSLAAPVCLIRMGLSFPVVAQLDHVTAVAPTSECSRESPRGSICHGPHRIKLQMGVSLGR